MAALAGVYYGVPVLLATGIDETRPSKNRYASRWQDKIRGATIKSNETKIMEVFRDSH